MEPYLAIMNPAAGGGKCRRRAPTALAEIRATGLSLEVQETKAAGDAGEMAQDAYQKGIRRFIAVGGDGTGFEIVNGLMPLVQEKGERPTLAFRITTQSPKLLCIHPLWICPPGD